jgi:methylated-DNA-protein-cysteine methyltransferase-like protein
VVDRNGILSGGWAFGRPDIMRQLLLDEGVPFLPDGRVNLAECLWEPDL